MTDTASNVSLAPLNIARPGDGGLIAELTSEAQTPEPVQQSDWISYVVPDGKRLVLVDPNTLEQRAPRTVAGTTILDRVESFIDHVEEFAIAEHTRLYVEPKRSRITAVYNGHALDIPGSGDHRAALELNASEDRNEIEHKSSEMMTQTGFAEWLEQYGRLIHTPDAATIMETVLTLEQTKSVEWRSAVRLSDGQRQLSYVETAAAKAGRKGELSIPDELVFAVDPYDGWSDASGIALTAKFRYRITDGDLKIGYQLIDLHGWRRRCFDSVIERISEVDDTGHRRFASASFNINVPVLYGTPPEPADPPSTIISPPVTR